MTTLYTLAIIAALLITAAFCVSVKWGLIVSGVLAFVAVVILGLQFFGWRL